MANNGKNNRRRGQQRNKQPQNRETKVSQETVKLNCVRCSETIRNPETALSTPENGDPIHFDCAIREVADKEELGPKEKVCYLGQGTFGVIQYGMGKNEQGFSIKKRIPYETAEKTVEWRKTIRNSVLDIC